MTTNTKLKISARETKKTEELNELLEEWKSHISKKEKVNNGHRENWATEECFAGDGFFPGYFSTEKKRILFIGRETRSIGGYGINFVDSSIAFFKNAHNLDEKNRLKNSNSFWRHILKIIYGIQNNGILYKEIPSSVEIADLMLKQNNFGFAVINISKYSNDSKIKWQLNTKLANRFLKDSDLQETNFFKRELQILEPDIIIAANLWNAGFEDEYLELCLPRPNKYKTKNSIEYWDYNLDGKKSNIKVINTYHFSARKSDKDCFYNPIRKILFE